MLYYRGVRRISLFVSTIAVVAVLGFAAACSSRPSQIDKPAPDFTVRDADRSVTLSQLRGQVVVLNFWASWCGPCIEETPSLQLMQQRMKAKGVTVLAVSIDDDDDAYHHFLAVHHIDFLTVRDAEHKSNALYGTFRYPETYVIDRSGVVRRKFIGQVDWTEPEVTDFLSKL